MYTLADVTIQSFGMTHICKPLVFTHNPSSIKSTLSHMKKNLWSSRSNVFGVYYLPSTCKSVWGRWRQCIKDVVHKATAKKSKTLTYKDLKWIFTVKNHEKCPLHPLSVHRRSRPYSGPVVNQSALGRCQLQLGFWCIGWKSLFAHCLNTNVYTDTFAGLNYT